VSLSLATYKVALQESSSSSKQSNMIQALEDAFNLLGDPAHGAWAAGQILTPSQIGQGGATTGQAMIWNGSSWAPGAYDPTRLAAGGAVAGQVLGYTGTAWGPVSPTGLTVIEAKTTAKVVNNTAVETDLFNGEFTVPANAMGTNKRCRLWAAGDMLQNQATTTGIRIRLKFGATTVIDTGVGPSLSQQANRNGWVFYGEMMEVGATNAQMWSFQFMLVGPSGNVGNSITQFAVGLGTFSSPVTAQGGPHWAIGVSNGLTAVDTTANQTLQLTVQNGVASTLYETVLRAGVGVIG
jgi:hypothetical protein